MKLRDGIGSKTFRFPGSPDRWVLAATSSSMYRRIWPAGCQNYMDEAVIRNVESGHVDLVSLNNDVEVVQDGVLES